MFFVKYGKLIPVFDRHISKQNAGGAIGFSMTGIVPDFPSAPSVCGGLLSCAPTGKTSRKGKVTARHLYFKSERQAVSFLFCWITIENVEKSIQIWTAARKIPPLHLKNYSGKEISRKRGAEPADSRDRNDFFKQNSRNAYALRLIT